VKVRKYAVDCERLQNLLREHKKLVGKSNKALAEALDVPVTMAEHWFRTDSCFSIPDAEVWDKLKSELAITTSEFDEAITTFEERTGVYEKSERCYFADGIAPTLTSTSAGNEKIIVEEMKMQKTKQRIRKLTPKECFRLMDFDDTDYEKAATVNSNTQLYKQAGNSIVVAVPKFIIAQLLECGALSI
jgi:site-specific DNA-cytosine methylase